MLSLTAAKGDEPEVAISELEQLQAKGEAELLKFLKEQTGRGESALSKALAAPKEGVEAKKLRAACGNDDTLFNQVRPFSGLVRNDTFDRPVVIRKGSVYVTAGTDRRSSGTHYTPRSLTEPIVQYTLEPLVYIGPAEGKPKEEWKLRSAKELLDLKICDMACGSGAFLVQACRYMSERLVEAWEDAEKRHPGVPGITPEGSASTGAANEQLIPRDTDERLTYARRIVAQRCLYGVDKNPLAAEMAKLSLWLLTLAKYKPFTFLDHAIRCGDSLVGIRDIRQVQYFQLDLDQADRSLFAGPVMGLVDEAVALRKKIEALPANTVEDVRDKERLLAEAEGKTARLRLAADLLISVEFQLVLSAGEKEALHNSMAIQAGHYVQNGTLEDFRAAAKKVMNGLPTFHWPLEFPEVMLDRGGFDAFVCNPPFMGGKKITGNLGTLYRDHLVDHLAGGQKGHADLCAYFSCGPHRCCGRGSVWLPGDEHHRTRRHSRGRARPVDGERMRHPPCCAQPTLAGYGHPRSGPRLAAPGTMEQAVRARRQARGGHHTVSLRAGNHQRPAARRTTWPPTPGSPSLAPTSWAWVSCWSRRRHGGSLRRLLATKMFYSPTSTAKTSTPGPTSRPDAG